VDNRHILLVLRLGSLGCPLVFHCLMVADGTTGGRPEHGMMTRHVAGDGADGCTSGAAGLGGGDGGKQGDRHDGGNDQGFHPRASLVVGSRPTLADDFRSRDSAVVAEVVPLHRRHPRHLQINFWLRSALCCTL
jgi:hypothetical protein